MGICADLEAASGAITTCAGADMVGSKAKCVASILPTYFSRSRLRVRSKVDCRRRGRWGGVDDDTIPKGGADVAGGVFELNVDNSATIAIEAMRWGCLSVIRPRPKDTGALKPGGTCRLAKLVVCGIAGLT